MMNRTVPPGAVSRALRASLPRALRVLPMLMALGALPAASAQAACDAKCLGSLLDRYLVQLVKHDPAPLPVAKNLAAVENAKPTPLGEGSWQGIKSLPVAGHRFADAATGQVVYYGATELADGKIGSMFVRLKVVDKRIVESELITRGEAKDTLGLLEPDILYPTVVPAARRSTRGDLVKVVRQYLDGISRHDGSLFPASERCDRFEAGKKFTNSYARPIERGGGTCQSSMNTLTGQEVANARFPVVDVERGIVVVIFIIPHAERTPKNSTNVAEVFKIVDGKVRSIEEFFLPGEFPPVSGFADEVDR